MTRRILSALSGILFLALVVWIVFEIRNIAKLHERRMENSVAELVSSSMRLRNNLENRIAETERAIDLLTLSIQEEKPDSDEEFREILTRILDQFPGLFGAIVGFLPEHSPVKGQLYAPYLIRGNEGYVFRQVQESYDYRKPTHAWFAKTMEKGAHLTDLYYGESAKDWMVTHAEQFTINDAQGLPVVAGVVGAEYSLNQIWSFISPGSIRSDGYAFIVNREGKLLAHPDSPLVAAGIPFEELIEANEASDVAAIMEAVRNGKPIDYRLESFGTDQPAIARITPIEGTNWMLGRVVNTPPWGTARTELLRDLILFTALTVALVWMGALVYISTRPLDAVAWAATAWIVSLTAFLGTTAIWTLNSQLGQYRDIDRAIIGMDAPLEELVAEDLANTAEEHRPTPIISEVGLVTRAIKKSGVNEFDASGIIWQRLPLDRPANVTHGLFFPDAQTSEFIEQYRFLDGDHEVVGWKFNAVLRQSFDNHYYPFDRLNFRLRIRQKDLSPPIMIVPDLPAYRLGVPAALPYVASNTVLAGWVIERTFFTMSQTIYDMDFGIHKNNLVDDLARTCSLNIIVRREWLSSLMAVLLPIFIIIAISFAGLRMISSSREYVTIMDFKPQRMVTLAATFCLFLVLAAAGLRTQLSSAGIFYAEWLFFLLYLLLGVNCWLGSSIASGKGFLSQRDGRIIKRGYWPCVLTLIYLITFLVFFPRIP